jgi:long-chain fatty acid adenylyltransferase FadD28
MEPIIQEITRGRCVAIAVPDEGTKKLVAVIELKKRGGTHEDAMDESNVQSPRRSRCRAA